MTYEKESISNRGYAAFFSISVSCSLCIPGYQRTKVSQSWSLSTFVRTWSRLWAPDSLHCASAASLQPRVTPTMLIPLSQRLGLSTVQPTIPLQDLRMPHVLQCGFPNISHVNANGICVRSSGPRLGLWRHILLACRVSVDC